MPRNDYQLCEGIKWIEVSDPSQQEMEELSTQYGLNNNTVKDCMQPEHLPKYEEENGINFLILRFYADEENKPIATIQELSNKIAIFYTDTFVITIHKARAVFIEEIMRKFATLKKCLSVTEFVVKVIWNALETFDEPANKLSDKLDSYESEVMLGKTSDDQMRALYYIKHKASVSHKVLMLMAEPINHQLPKKNEKSIVQDMRDQYLKMLTLYGQIVEDVNNLMNLSISVSAKRTNEVMRVLTIFSVFFMPITFIVGVYGMNFKFMPELNWRLGYPAVILFMALVTLIVYLWFKRKKWL